MSALTSGTGNPPASKKESALGVDISKSVMVSFMMLVLVVINGSG